jgi:cell fate regulator YaaT (PSP1 superfamily)
MCCLTYEHDSYLAARKRFPREGRTIRTLRGQEKVIGIDIWRDLVTLLDESRQRRVVKLLELRAETEAALRADDEAAPEAVEAREEEVAAEAAQGAPARRRRRKRRSGGGGGGGDEQARSE